MSVPLIKELFELRKKFETNYLGFPDLSCIAVSSAVKYNLGYGVVGDAFVLVPNKEARQHFWNVTPDEVWYVDLSGDQFNDRLNGLVIPRVHVVRVGSDRAKRFYCLRKDADIYVKRPWLD